MTHEAHEREAVKNSEAERGGVRNLGVHERRGGGARSKS